MIYVGIDLSGPTNIKDTAYACFEAQVGRLALTRSILGVTDGEIYHLVSSLASEAEVFVGLDAPLSYNPGGGDRPGDRNLRRQIISAGLASGSVMTPTMVRMAYLTLRGVSVARLLGTITPQPPKIVEVHPAGAMVLRGAPVQQVKDFKHDAFARRRLCSWLEAQGLDGIDSGDDPGDHRVAAYAAALAAWKWQLGEPAWLEPANPPIHPFDYVC